MIQSGSCYDLMDEQEADPIALSCVKAKYVVACEVGKNLVWLRNILTYLFKSLSPNVINCDNQSFIKISGDPFFHSRTKHIKNKFHFIKKLVQDGIVKLEYVLTDEQVADTLTKALPNKMFKYLRNLLDLVDIGDCINDKEMEYIC